jgi:hypothetical protein
LNGGSRLAFSKQVPSIAIKSNQIQTDSKDEVQIKIDTRNNRHAIISALEAGRQGLTGGRNQGQIQGSKTLGRNWGKDKVQNSVRVEIQVKLQCGVYP